MASTNAPNVPDGHLTQLREEWNERLRKLVDQVNDWSRELDWSTREISKTLDDAELGPHQVPVLVLQRETARVLLEPIARLAPGAEGVVDLYLLPAYDDIASLYYCDGVWQLHYMGPNDPTVATIRSAKSTPLTKDSLQMVIEEMKNNAA